MTRHSGLSHVPQKNQSSFFCQELDAPTPCLLPTPTHPPSYPPWSEGGGWAAWWALVASCRQRFSENITYLTIWRTRLSYWLFSFPACSNVLHIRAVPAMAVLSCGFTARGCCQPNGVCASGIVVQSQHMIIVKRYIVLLWVVESCSSDLLLDLLLDLLKTLAK